jgi:hypothetical protein
LLLRRTDTRCEEKREMSGTRSNTFQSYDARALGAFNDLLLRDCGLSRYGKNVVAAVDDPRIVRVRKPSWLHRLFNAVQAAMQSTTVRTDAGKVAAGDLISPRGA